MATTSSIKILNNPVALDETWLVAKKSNEVIAQGDLLQDTGSGAEVTSSAANATFIGVALAGREADDDRPVPVAFKAVIQGKMAAGQSVTKGQAVAYSAGGNGTEWTFAHATVNGIGWALESIAAGEKGKILIDVTALETGIFETVTSA